MTYEELAKELLDRISKISDDYYPSCENENKLALNEMREALQKLDEWGCDAICNATIFKDK